MKYKAKSLKRNAESRDCTVYGVRKFAFSVGKKNTQDISNTLQNLICNTAFIVIKSTHTEVLETGMSQYM